MELENYETEKGFFLEYSPLCARYILDRRNADQCLAKKKAAKSVEEENAEWEEKYGAEGAKIIREAVDANIADYEYLKSFAIKV